MLKLEKVKFNINSIIECTESEGPYKRLAIWFQGCKFNCKNCSNIEMHSYKPNNIYNLHKVMEIIQRAKDKYNIEGITLLGGEPIDQIGLISLLIKVKELELGIILFTGYKYNQVNKKVLNNIDMLIDGLYIDELRLNNNSIVGSSNQEIYCLSNRYSNDDLIINSSEINIIDNSIVLNGKL